MQPEEIIKRKIELVILKRDEFIAKNFRLGDDLMIKKHYNHGSKPSLVIPSWIDDILLKKLKIKDKRQKQWCRQIRIGFKSKFKNSIEGEWVYNETTSFCEKTSRLNVANFSYKRWALIERYLRAFIDNKEELREIKKTAAEEERKTELCRLTKCYDDKVGTSLCECGWVNRPEAKYCAECGVSLI